MFRRTAWQKKKSSKCEETNRQTRKGSKYFALCLAVILFSTCIPCHHRWLLLAALFSSFTRGCAAFINRTKEFSKSMNGIDCSIFERKRFGLIFRLLRISLQFTLFRSFIHSLRRLFFIFSLVLIIASQRNNTWGNRSALTLANFLLIARVWLLECGRFEWQKCRNQTNYKHVFFISTSAKTFGPSSVLTLNTSKDRFLEVVNQNCHFFNIWTEFCLESSYFILKRQCSTARVWMLQIVLE